MDDGATLIARLQAELGADAVITDASGLDGFIEDFRRRFKARALCVVKPKSTAEVAAVVRLCAAAGVPILPQGGNTSLCGGAVPADGLAAPVRWKSRPAAC
jgi:FAD/FMN-containing dehydrogenase